MFSVVITTKDRHGYLERAVNSVCKNTVKPTEVIIVNDGGSKLDALNFDLNGVTVSIFDNLISKGANYSRNLGVEKSNCDIIFFLDDDDAVMPDSFEKRLEKFSSSNVGLVFTGVQLVESTDLCNVKRIVSDCISSPTCEQLLKNGNIIGSTSRVAVRRSAFYSAGKFDETLSCMQDYDLWLRMSKISRAEYDGHSTVLYTIHNDKNQVSSNYFKYLTVGQQLRVKYASEIEFFDLEKCFLSSVYLRVSLAASGNKEIDKIKFAAMSFFLRPNIRSLALMLIPSSIIKLAVSYV